MNLQSTKTLANGVEMPRVGLGVYKMTDRDETLQAITTALELGYRAGGVGLFLQHCPNAEVIVHPKGARHLEDPTRLVAGAKEVYGEDFDKLFNPILPVPLEKIIVKGNKETLETSDNGTLTS